MNKVQNYSMLQGVTHPSDLSYQVIRDINSRYITIENSSNRTIGVAIATYICGETPKIMFLIVPGQVHHLGVNSHGEVTQYIWLINPENGLQVSDPKSIQSNANQFVCRDGINGWYIHTFKMAAYRASY